MSRASPFTHAGMRTAFSEEGDGLHLTLLHGVGASLQSWDSVADAMGPGFRFLRYDLRGHGESAKPPGPYSLNDFVTDLKGLLEHCRVERTHLVGFSFGGMIAQAFALAHPTMVAGLVCVSAVAGRTTAERAAVIKRADALESDGAVANAEAALERWFTPEFRAANPELIEARVRQNVDNDPAGYAAAYRVFAESDLNAKALSDVSMPALIMTGEHDVGSSPRMAQLMHAAIAGSRLEILPNLRHSVLIEAPVLVANSIRDFVASAG